MKIDDWNASAPIEILPEGGYLVEITSWKREKNKNTGNEHLQFNAEVVKPAAYTGKTLVDFVTITEQSLWRVKSFIMNCLNSPKDLPKMDTNSVEFENILNACKGRKMIWNVIVDAFNGKERNKTAKFDAYGMWDKNEPFSVDSVADVPDWVKE